MSVKRLRCRLTGRHWIYVLFPLHSCESKHTVKLCRFSYTFILIIQCPLNWQNSSRLKNIHCLCIRHRWVRTSSTTQIAHHSNGWRHTIQYMLPVQSVITWKRLNIYIYTLSYCVVFFAERDWINAHKDHLYCILKINKLNTMHVDKAIALHYKQILGNIWDSIRL